MISILVAIAITGLVVYLITSFVPMPEPFKRAIYAVAAVCLLLYVLSALGLWHGFGTVRILK